MAKRQTPLKINVAQVRALLDRYECPVPFHEVRTRLLGNIATPNMGASPLRVVEGLWGGSLPEFETLDEANELVNALIMGLWNQLARHQNRSEPFRLIRIETPGTREGLASLALMRRQEIEGFIEGLFGSEEEIDLPERSHRGLETLSETRALFGAVLAMVTDETKPATEKEFATTLERMRDMTRIAETEIHAIILSCKRARRQMLEALPTEKPTLH
jgi:hypothetical protein